MTVAGRRTRVIAIVGGGASGVVLAAHILRRDLADLRILLIEKRPRLGEGVAYSTLVEDHVLNVSANGMSAIADIPDHFSDWLRGQGRQIGDGEHFYAPRRLYADYLRDFLEAARGRSYSSLNVVEQCCEAITPTRGGVEIRLANGTSLAAHCAVLATGHEAEVRPEHSLTVRPRSPQDTPLAPDAPVLVLGTGLSMVDAWLDLAARGHKGPIIALSRRGLLPRAHAPCRPLRFDQADIPLGTELSYAFGWLKDRLKEADARGLDWRAVIDGIRPYNQAIWQSWPAGARRRFLTHARAWWDVHRHRLAPDLHQRLSRAIGTGDLSIVAARVTSIAGRDGRVEVECRLRRTGEPARFRVERVYDCSGVVRDVSKSKNPVLRSLVDQGLARPDPLKLGLDVATDCAVLDRDGRPSDRLFAIGPLTRGTFFEIEAIPDIRVQCAALAERLAGSAHSR